MVGVGIRPTTMATLLQQAETPDSLGTSRQAIADGMGQVVAVATTMVISGSTWLPLGHLRARNAYKHLASKCS